MIEFQVKEYKIVIAGGVFTVLFVLFILVMRLRYPSDGGNPAVFYLALLLLMAAGVLCFLRGILYGLQVEEMRMRYRSSVGRVKEFTLDDIGYCRLDVSQSRDNLVLYDLLGKVLCKLKLNMKGCEELLQYLRDNQVRIEWETTRTNLFALEIILRETAICEEEIPKYAEALYRQVREVFSQWERKNASFGATWEVGYAEFSAADFEDYTCVLEAYLKKDGEYVMSRKNEAVCMIFPYLTRCRSYQIGEKLRLRKMDETMITDYIKEHLLFLTQTLPKHKYHTEAFALQHTLGKTAGKRNSRENDLKEEIYGTGSTMYGTDEDLRQEDSVESGQFESGERQDHRVIRS